MFSEFVTCRGTLVGNEPLSYSDKTKGYLLIAIELKRVMLSKQNYIALLKRPTHLPIETPQLKFIKPYINVTDHARIRSGMRDVL